MHLNKKQGIPYMRCVYIILAALDLVLSYSLEVMSKEGIIGKKIVSEMSLGVRQRSYYEHLPSRHSLVEFSSNGTITFHSTDNWKH